MYDRNNGRPTRQEMRDKLKLQLENMKAINTACAKDDDLTREEHEDYREPLSYDIEKKSAYFSHGAALLTASISFSHKKTNHSMACISGKTGEPMTKLNLTPRNSIR